MTTFNYHFRPSLRPGRSKGSIFIRVIHERRSFSLSTGYRVYPEEWDSLSRNVIVPHHSSGRFASLKRVREGMDAALAEFERTVAELESRGRFTVADIRSALRSKNHSEMLSDFVGHLIAEISTKQPRTAQAYGSVVKAVREFNLGRDVRISYINRSFVESFEAHLKEKGLCMNTISFYMRNLRSIYNRAVRRNLVPYTFENPFKGVFTGIKATEKKALDAGQISSLIKLDPTLFNFRFEGKSPLAPGLRDSLAMFIFCFFAQGMSFVDMAYLKKTDIRDGVIKYRRKKTGQMIEVAVCSEMRSIIKYFAARTKDIEYVFPVIVRKDKSERLQYESALRLQNHRLKKLGIMTASVGKVSTHAARHSWATIAKNEKVELAVISEALGHNNESTTRIYLDSFKRKLLDKANEKIRRAIKKAV